jgi:hypothetical protein
VKFAELTAEQHESLKERDMIGDEIPQNLLKCPGETIPGDHGPETVEKCDFVSVSHTDVCPTHGTRLV